MSQKKLVVVGIGGIRRRDGTGLEEYVQCDAPSVTDAIRQKLDALRKADEEAGLEKQQMDTVGEGTGLPLGKYAEAQNQSAVRQIQINATAELTSQIKEELKDADQAAIVLGDDIDMDKETRDALDELEEEGVAIYTPDEIDSVVGNIDSLTVCEAVEPPYDNDEEEEIDLGAIVGEPGAYKKEEDEEPN